MRLLLLEADKALGESAAERLLGDGHWVDHVERLRDARLHACESYDVLIVSWQLPDGSGLPWVTALRSRGVGTAVVVLAEPRCAVDPLGAALAAGANDCLLVPVDLDMLATRVRDARLRVAGLTTACLRSGDVELDLKNRSAFRGGEHVALTGREWNLVEALALRFDRIVPKAQLALLVHGLAASPASTALEVHLSNVRRKLGRRLIRTVRGAGYRMTT
jgi:two-component system OmpR family response regulator